MSLDFSNIPICGREKELEMLERAAEKSSVVFVSAAPGVGKTSLINTFRARHEHSSRINNSPVFFSQGSYSENEVEPFAMMKSSMRDIISQWQPDDRRKLRNLLDETTMAEIEPLLVILPELWDKITEGEDQEEVFSKVYMPVSSSELDSPSARSSGLALERLGLAVRSFVRLVSKIRRMIIIADDVQWIPRRLRSVLTALFQDSQIQDKVTIISGHRDDPSALEIVAGIKKEVPPQRLINLPLQHLNLDTVTDLISKLSRRERDESDVVELASIAHHRTHGNAFFVIELLSQMVRRKYISQGLGERHWTIDIDSVIANAEVSENVVHLVVDRICSLEEKVQETLSVAACLGIQTIDACIISGAIHGSLTEPERKRVLAVTNDHLRTLCDKGLLLKIGNNGVFKFAHHRVLAAASSLLPSDKTDMHERFGKNLRDHANSTLTTSESSFSKNQVLLLSMDHLSRCAFALCEEVEMLDLAQFGIQVAEIAQNQFAFHIALGFLQVSRDWLLRCKGWSHNYELLLRCTVELSKVAYSFGELALCLSMAEDVISHSKSIDDHLPLLRTMAFAHLQSDHVNEAQQLCLSAIQDLGVDFPSTLILVKSIVKIKKLLKQCRKKPDSFFETLQPCRNSRIRYAYDLIEVISYIALSLKRNEFVLAGLSSSACLMYEHGEVLGKGELANLLGFFSISLGNHREAARYARLVRKGLPQIGHNRDHAVLWLANRFYVDHNFHAAQEALPPLVESHRTLLKAGDSAMLGTCMCAYSLIYFQCGLSLEFVVPDGQRVLEIMEGLRLNYSKRLFLPVLQMFLNLRGDSQNPLLLNGRIMESKSFLGENVESQAKDNAIRLYHFCVLCLNVIFGSPENAVKAAKKMIAKEDKSAVAWAPLRAFFGSMAHFMAAKSTGGLKRQRYLQNAKSHLRWLQQRQNEGNPNCSHYIALCQAELLSIKASDATKVRAAYDDAIRLAARIGVLYCKALANESVARYFLSKNEIFWFETYMKRAIQDYVDWGAIAKVNQLLEEYPTQLFQAGACPRPTTANISTVSYDLELGSGISGGASTQLTNQNARNYPSEALSEDDGDGHNSSSSLSLNMSPEMSSNARRGSGINARRQFSKLSLHERGSSSSLCSLTNVPSEISSSARRGSGINAKSNFLDLSLYERDLF